MQKDTRRRTVVAVLAALAMIIGGLAGTAGPAAAAIKHTCAVVGTPDSYGNHAVHCVDLDLTNTGYVAATTSTARTARTRSSNVRASTRGRVPARTTSPPAVTGPRRLRSTLRALPVRRPARGELRTERLPGVCAEFWAITIGTSVVLPQSGKTVSGGLVGSHYTAC